MAELIEALDSERLRSNLDYAREQIAVACRRSGRSAGEVELLAATKYVPAELMGELAKAGVGLVGENTSAALVAKHEHHGDQFVFDFIGHLQSRKTKHVLPLVRLIHSVESDSVVDQIERHAAGRTDVLLEVNVSGEASKHGIEPGQVDDFLERTAGAGKVNFAGLMTMPPFSHDPEDARPYFAALRELAERLRTRWAPRHGFELLSMGTSQDYVVAVEEGASIVRLGGALYR